MRIAYLLAIGPALALSCAAGQGADSAGVGGGAVTSASSSTGAVSGPGGGGSMGTFSGSVTVGSGGAMGMDTVYVHTNTTLFQVDPTTLAMTTIGDFDCIGNQPGQDTSMTDIAVNQQGDLWAVSQTKVYKLQIQGTTVHCALSIPLVNAQSVRFYALTFAPVGVLDPTAEVLIAGNADGELWAIDAQGNLSLHGNFGNVPPDDGHGHAYPKANQGKRFELSGDLVFLANKGSPVGFATVRDCPSPPSTASCSATDTLIEIDLSKLQTATTQSVLASVRGQIVQKAGCMGTGMPYGSMYGIAAFDDKVYGFSHKGDLVTIDNVDASACLVRTDAANQWSGAGVTTVAPVIPPPN